MHKTRNFVECDNENKETERPENYQERRERQGN